MTLPYEWKKSSYSSTNGSCVETTEDDAMILVRDSKLGDESPILSFTPREWVAFTNGVKDGEFDLST